MTQDIANTSSRQDLIDRLSSSIDRLGWRNLRLAEEMLRPHRLTFPQVLVLTFLSRLGPDLEMSRIAGASGLPASTITSIMDRLVKRGLAQRHPGTTDRRSVTGSITAQGQDMLAVLERERDQSLARIVGECSDDEIRTLLRIIDRYLTHTEGG